MVQKINYHEVVRLYKYGMSLAFHRHDTLHLRNSTLSQLLLNDKSEVGIAVQQSTPAGAAAILC